MKKLRIFGVLIVGMMIVMSLGVSGVSAQEQSCKSKIVGMWRRGLRGAVDKVTQGYLDGKVDGDGLQEPISNLVAYSVYLIPCVQTMGEDWDPAMKVLIDSSQKEFSTSNELASFIFVSQMKKSGANLHNVKGFWEGQDFKLLP